MRQVKRRPSIKQSEMWVRVRWQLAKSLGPILRDCLWIDLCFGGPELSSSFDILNYQLVSLLAVEIIMFGFVLFIKFFSSHMYPGCQRLVLGGS